LTARLLPPCPRIAPRGSRQGDRRADPKRDDAERVQALLRKKKLRAQPCSVSAAVERSAWFIAALLLRHVGTVANKFRKNRDRLFAGSVEPINTYAVIGVGVFRDLEHTGRCAVVKFHGQRIRREDVVGDITAPFFRRCLYMSLHRRCLPHRPKAKLQSLQAKGISWIGSTMRRRESRRIESETVISRGADPPGKSLAL
jgi:hypothetical protein